MALGSSAACCTRTSDWEVRKVAAWADLAGPSASEAADYSVHSLLQTANHG